MNDCSADTDCSSLAGLRSSCASGACRIDCAGPFKKGDGLCPAGMACIDTSFGGIVSTYTCLYPPGAGTNSVATYARCTTAHGDADCAGKSTCHVPRGPLGSAEGAGYCSDACASAADCPLPNGTTAAPLCANGLCELDCSGNAVTCPAGLTCRDVGTFAPLYRCRVSP